MKELLKKLQSNDIKEAEVKRIIFAINNLLSSDVFGDIQEINEILEEEILREANSSTRKKSAEILLGELNGAKFVENRCKDYLIICKSFLDNLKEEKKLKKKEKKDNLFASEPGEESSEDGLM